MITALNLNQLARMSAESMLNCVLEGIAIGLFAWILLRVVGRRNSSTRFAVWFFALLAIAALPVLERCRTERPRRERGFCHHDPQFVGARYFFRCGR